MRDDLMHTLARRDLRRALNLYGTRSSIGRLKRKLRKREVVHTTWESPDGRNCPITTLLGRRTIRRLLKEWMNSNLADPPPFFHFNDWFDDHPHEVERTCDITLKEVEQWERDQKTTTA